jgi:hypothetical protein
MTVSWNTYSPLSQPVVYYYRTDSSHHKLGGVQKSAPGTSNTYPTSKTYNHHVVLKDLQPATTYRYTVADDSKSSEPKAAAANAGFGPWYEFTTARKAGDEEPYSMAVVVDMGLMGKRGLSSKVGKGAANPLGPGDLDTMESLERNLDGFDFLWHRETAPPLVRTLFKF